MLANKNENNQDVQAIVRGLRTWIAGAMVFCTIAGIVTGFLLAGLTAEAERGTTVAATPDSLSASFAEIAKQTEPAVVNIDTKTNAPETTARGGSDPKTEEGEESDNPILEYFRRNQPRRPSYSVGSGFIVDPKGYILTNYHVVEDTNKITVRLESGEEFVADVVGTDEPTDLAVLKINAGRDLPTVRLGDSNSARVGDWVLAVGSPFGLDQTVTAGIISQIERTTPGSNSFQKFIQTDAAINRGNSGGPLVNMRGEVVGVNSQIATTTGDYNGIGFALPANEAAYVYTQILQNKRVRRGFLGVTLDSVKAEFAKVYGLGETKGAFITDIRDEAGAAARAGLQINDVVVEFNGQAIVSAQDLIAKVASTAPDTTVNIVYLRENADRLERRTATVKLGERPLEQSESRRVLQPREEKPVAVNAPRLGLSVVELSPQLAATNKLGGQKGVFVKDVDPNGVLADVKIDNRLPAIRESDLITRVNRTSVNSVAEFTTLVSRFKTGDAVVLHVSRYDDRAKKIVTRIVQFTFQ